jgi:hypothetical protein
LEFERRAPYIGRCQSYLLRLCGVACLPFLFVGLFFVGFTMMANRWGMFNGPDTPAYDKKGDLPALSLKEVIPWLIASGLTGLVAICFTIIFVCPPYVPPIPYPLFTLLIQPLVFLVHLSTVRIVQVVYDHAGGL